MAEGQRQARILASEADKMEQINAAKGRSEALELLSTAMEHKQGGLSF